MCVNIYLEELSKCGEMNAMNNAAHILFVCPCNSKLRNILWNEVKTSTSVIFKYGRSVISRKDQIRFPFL